VSALDDAALSRLRENAARLAVRALEDLLAGLPAELPPVAPPPDEPSPAMLHEAAMDLSALDAVLSGAQPDATGAWDLEAELAALPSSLPPLTQPLDEAGFRAWLALYHQGHEGLHRLVAGLQAQR
jgi:hypothetical protein